MQDRRDIETLTRSYRANQIRPPPHICDHAVMIRSAMLHAVQGGELDLSLLALT